MFGMKLMDEELILRKIQRYNAALRLKTNAVLESTNLQNCKAFGIRSQLLEKKIEKIRPWIEKNGPGEPQTSDKRLLRQLKKVKVISVSEKSSQVFKGEISDE